jgi:site-specific recombinase XerD
MAIKDRTECIAELRLERARLRQGLIARNTVIGYGYDVKMYAAWCEQFEFAALPSTTETLGLYLTDLLSQGKRINTARRRRCAIIHEHRSHGLPSPDATEIRELLLGAQRLRAEKPRQMKPITVKELRKMSASLARSGTAEDLRDRAILVLGFATALRRSNLGALSLGDIEFCRQGLIVSVDREKQDQTGKGRLVPVVRGRHTDSDPVGVLRAWLRVRGGDPGPLFPRLSIYRNWEQLDGECIYRVVKKRLAEIGIENSCYAGHSLRSGCVTAASDANITALRISAYTGQSPAIVQRYFRRTELWRDNIGGKLGL